MFDSWEALTCEKCGQSFMGRKSADGGSHFCPSCLCVEALAELKEGDALTEDMLAEITAGGRGEDG